MNEKLKILIRQIVNESFSEAFAPPPKMDGMKIKPHHKMMWAEGLVLPEDTEVPPSDVKIPFNIVDLNEQDLDVVNDCTVYKNINKDSREIERGVVKIDLFDPYLFATQRSLWLDRPALEKHGERKKSEPAIVITFPNNVKLIQDGHHRLSAMKLMGERSAVVELYRIMNWEDLSEEGEEFIKSLGPNITEMNAIGGGGVCATGGGGVGAWGSNKETHDMMWKEEKIGKRGKHGPTYFQMGGSLPDELYNKKDGKPSRDPGITGLKKKVNESFYHGTVIDLNPGEYLLPPNDTGKVSEKGRKKNLDKVFFTQDINSAMIYAGRAKHSLGGVPKVYLIEPEGSVDQLNAQPGTTVFMAPKAKIIKRIH